MNTLCMLLVIHACTCTHSQTSLRSSPALTVVAISAVDHWLEDLCLPSLFYQCPSYCLSKLQINPTIHSCSDICYSQISFCFASCCYLVSTNRLVNWGKKEIASVFFLSLVCCLSLYESPWQIFFILNLAVCSYYSNWTHFVIFPCLKINLIFAP